MQFANQVLLCTAADVTNFSPDPRVLRLIAVVALSFFCLLHYFSGRAGRDLNQVLAFIKVGFLLVLFFAGIARASHHFEADWSHKANPNASSSATAFLYIIFSFSGWENATFV
jgi:amino acid transporter